MEADFSGYATKNGLKCTDGRIIHAGAFTENNKQRVPLVWQHGHNDVGNVLGHGILEERSDGMYVQGFFNDSENGKHAKKLVQHGDIKALSIYANNLVQQGPNVIHGAIKEVSLVISGANPGALIDNVSLAHSDGVIEILEDEAVISTGEELELTHSADTAKEPSTQEILETLNDDQRGVIYGLFEKALAHSDEEETEEEGDDEDEDELEDLTNVEGLEELTEEQQVVVHSLLGAALQHADTSKGAPVAEKTVEDIVNSMSEEQQEVLQFLIGSAVEDATTGKSAAHSDINQEGGDMSRNLFDQTNGTTTQADRHVLTHSQVNQIVRGAASNNMKLGDYVLQHAGDYGIDNIELLFPDAKTVGDMPNIVSRQADWVPLVLDATKKQPFARIKSIVADLTPEEARAKGYIKGKMKKEEVIGLLKRTTGPTTVYKKQKLDRDDVIDITDFDVIAWLKWEIRFMLNEEIARAILVGDGRSLSNDDKIKDPAGALDGNGIRSILHEDDLYAHKLVLAANVANDVIIDEVALSRQNYRGSGSPAFYTTDKVLTGLLLLKDKMGRRLYETEAALASALRVSSIVAVEVLEEYPTLIGIMVNLVDYTVGTDKGGELSFFEDFDIDFNQNKYLLEARMSGALTKPKSAIVISRDTGTEVTPTAPSFNGATNTITVPNKTGVEYVIDDDVVTGSVVITKDTEIDAQAADGYYIPGGTTSSWTYTYTAH